MNAEELNEEEKRAFDQLINNAIPPKALEQKIVDQLVEKGEIKRENHMHLVLKRLAVAAVLILLFGLGFYAGKFAVLFQGHSDIPVAYMLLLHEDSDFIPGDPDERFSEYAQWMFGTAQRGIPINGQEMAPEASYVLSPNQYVDVPSDQESKITGYFVVSTTSIEQAVEVAQTCPHVKYGGKIEVKKIISN